MLTEYTGIFTTADELQARRVLQNVMIDGTRPAFLFKEGFFEIVFPGILDPDQAHNLNTYAHAVANTDLKPLPLAVFTQEEAA